MVIKKTAIKILITGGVLVAVILIAKKFNIGTKVIGGFGDLAGVITGGPLQFLKSFAEGAGEIGEEAVKVSENFQRALSGGLLASEQELFGGGGFVGGTRTEQTLRTIPGGNKFPSFLENAFTAFQPDLLRIPTRPKASQIFNISSAFTPQAQDFRLSGGNVTAIRTSFANRLDQEAALQKAIAQSRQRFPEFFKV